MLDNVDTNKLRNDRFERNLQTMMVPKSVIDLKLKICSGENSHIKHTKYKLKLFDVKFKDLQWGNVTCSM